MSAPLRESRKTLDRVLSRAGAMSRKQAEEAIRAGRVRVNRLRATDPGLWVDLAQDAITLDDAPLIEFRALHIALHKPVGYVTTRSDERGRATVYDLVRDVPVWIAPIGRLDRDTSGLLLLTNDTDFAERVTNPASKLSKTYECVADGELDDAQLERLRAGVALDDGPTRPARVKRIGAESGRTLLSIAITEGRNRQVRRMLEAIGSRAVALHRTAIGAVQLGTLAPGAHRELSGAELRSIGGGRG